MGLPYLKVTPEEAIEALQDLIVSAYQLKDQTHDEHEKLKNTPDKLSAFYELSQKRSTDWLLQAISEMQRIYVSDVHAYNLRDSAKMAFVVTGVPRELSNVLVTLKARIDKLNEYEQFIQNHFNVKIEYRVNVGRDQINASGKGSSIEVKNK